MRYCFSLPFFNPGPSAGPGWLAPARSTPYPPRRVQNQPAGWAAFRVVFSLLLPASWPRRARLLGVCGGLGGALAAAGQGLAPVSGVVRGPAGGPVEFATITLHRVADSAVVKSEFSDAQGGFELRAPAGALPGVGGAGGLRALLERAV